VVFLRLTNSIRRESQPLGETTAVIGSRWGIPVGRQRPRFPRTHRPIRWSRVQPRLAQLRASTRSTRTRGQRFSRPLWRATNATGKRLLPLQLVRRQEDQRLRPRRWRSLAKRRKDERPRFRKKGLKSPTNGKDSDGDDDDDVSSRRSWSITVVR